MRIEINPQDKADRESGFVLAASVLVEGENGSCPELCGTPDKAATLSPEQVTLRSNGGEMERGRVDWYYTRLKGTTTLPHALLGLFKACLDRKERTSLKLSHKSGLDKIDIELLTGQGLLAFDHEKKTPTVPSEVKRIVRASIRVRVEDSESETVTLALQSPFKTKN